jgi:DNA polymerase-3 subunit delta
VKIGSEQLARRLDQGIAPLYAVYGEEPLVALEAADTIRAAARRAGFDTREVHHVDARFDWSRLEAGLGNFSLFGDRRLIELHVASIRLGRGGAERLAAFCAAPREDTVTLALLPELDWRDLKSDWFSTLERAAVMVAAEPVPLDRLPGWIAQRLAAQGQQAGAQTLEYIAARVEGNLLAARQEIDKLALLAPPGGLSLDDVRAALSDVARFDLDQLAPVLLAGDAPRALRILTGLAASGEEAPRVLWTLRQELRALLTLAAGRDAGRDAKETFRSLRIWDARQSGYRRALARLSRDTLVALFGEAARADRAIKGLSRDDPWQALTRLALGIAGAQTVPSTSSP